MLAAFRYLINGGSPTRWDGTCYREYRDTKLMDIAPDLADMVRDERFSLGTPETFWHAQLASLQIEARQMRLTFLSDSNERVYEFSYFDVQKVRTEFIKVQAMPSLIMQELTLLKTGIHRHALSDLGGRTLVVYCRQMSFSDVLRQ